MSRQILLAVEGDEAYHEKLKDAARAERLTLKAFLRRLLDEGLERRQSGRPGSTPLSQSTVRRLTVSGKPLQPAAPRKEADVRYEPTEE